MSFFFYLKKIAFPNCKRALCLLAIVKEMLRCHVYLYANDVIWHQSVINCVCPLNLYSARLLGNMLKIVVISIHWTLVIFWSTKHRISVISLLVYVHSVSRKTGKTCLYSYYKVIFPANGWICSPYVSNQSHIQIFRYQIIALTLQGKVTHRCLSCLGML